MNQHNHKDRLGQPIELGDWCMAVYNGPKLDGISIFRVIGDDRKMLKIKEINTKNQQHMEDVMQVVHLNWMKN